MKKPFNEQSIFELLCYITETCGHRLMLSGWSNPLDNEIKVYYNYDENYSSMTIEWKEPLVKISRSWCFSPEVTMPYDEMISLEDIKKLMVKLAEDIQLKENNINKKEDEERRKEKLKDLQNQIKLLGGE